MESIISIINKLPYSERQFELTANKKKNTADGNIVINKDYKHGDVSVNIVFTFHLLPFRYRKDIGFAIKSQETNVKSVTGKRKDGSEVSFKEKENDVIQLIHNKFIFDIHYKKKQ